MWELKAMQSLTALREDSTVSLTGNGHKPALKI
jgi:hypothetical protein